MTENITSFILYKKTVLCVRIGIMMVFCSDLEALKNVFYFTFRVGFPTEAS